MIDKVLAAVNRIFEVLIACLFFAIVIVGGLQVFNRFVLNQSLSWSEEFMVYANVWMVFLAIPVAYNRGSHIGMNLFVKGLPSPAQFGLALVIDTLWLGLSIAIVAYAIVVMGVASNQHSPALDLRMDRVYLSLVVGWSYMTLLALRKVVIAFLLLRSRQTAGGAPC
ncbi:MAG TPA: TRAP transporter small permease [Candidatus Acidoferrum sp.]|nr:TRAP transporter small permease [Candidatus Methylomirabilis sp.]HWU36241.1 TRAP transporter small permease [Candidatus Acidoferrum sp.]